MDLSYSNDVSSEIDQTRFDQQFFVNSRRGVKNHNVNPFARPNMINEPVQYKNQFPEDASRPGDEVILSTDCCNVPGQTIVVGRKSEDVPLENSTHFWNELQTIPAPNRTCRTTKRIGFDMTENQY